MYHMGHVCDDAEWYMAWQDSYDNNYPYAGWAEIDRQTRVYNNRLTVCLEYQRYSGWWRNESKQPRAVSDDGVIGCVRE